MKKCLIIVKKELSEIFRDKSTFIILLIPVFIFPFFNMGMNYLNKNSETKIDICIKSDNQEAYDTFTQFISENKNYKINIISSDAPKELLKNGDIDCYINIKNTEFDFVCNSGSYDSLSLTTKLGDGFQRFYNALLSQSYENVYQLNLKDENNNIADAFGAVSNIFVPIVLMMLIFQNTSGFANDIFAGEKERKTLELLLLSGVKKTAVYCGKSLTLIILSMINLTLSLGAYFISFDFTESGLQQFKFMQNGSAGLNIAYIIFAMLLLSIIAVFLSVSVSVMSKSMKNAQILNGIILTLPVAVTVLFTLGIIKKNMPFLRYIPILNLIDGFNNAFIGYIDITDAVFALITNIIFIAILIIASVKYMSTERIIA